MAYHYINYRYYYARYDEATRSIEIGHETYGKILTGCRFFIHTRDLNHVYIPIKPEDYKAVYCAHEKHLDGNGLAVCFADGPEALPFLTLRVQLGLHEVRFAVESERDADYFYDIQGTACWGESPETDTFATYSAYRGKGIRCAVGPAAGRGCDSLFDRKTDRMLTITGDPLFRYDYEAGAYSFLVRLHQGNTAFTLSVKEHKLAEQYALRYRPMNNDTVFKRPPVGWMTWYAVRHGACEEAVLANSRIQKEKLKAYGADAVWVDWEWYHDGVHEHDGSADFDTFTPNPTKYPNGLGYVADEIRKDGFTPCVWIGASHETRETDFIKDNPEVLLVKRHSWCGSWWFDPTHPKYLDEFIPSVFKNLTENWGYEAIKWDALPRAMDYYDQYHDDFYDPTVTSEQAMRNVVKKARETVGDKAYMLSCHGEATRDIQMYADVFDAARIGADIFSWSDFLESGVGRLYKYYPMHNVIQYCDPDNLVIREEFNTYDQAISRASLFALLGTPITLGDDLRELSDERIEIIRRAIPPMNTHPMCLDSKTYDAEVELVNTFIRTKYDEYQVVDVFNLTERYLTYDLKFTDLDLMPEEEYLVYDFWNKTFLGKIRHGLTMELRACQSRVLLIRKVLNRPQLVSTSRHITQGAFDVESMSWNAETKTLSGVSKTVAGEPYTITAYDPATNRPVVKTLEPQSESTSWEIVFA